MTTIKIKSTDPASQGPFVIIDRASYDPQRHELYGDDNDLSAALSEYVPSIEELKSAYARMEEQQAQLAAEHDRLIQQGAAQEAEAARLAEQAHANEVEAQRLRDEAAALAASQGAAPDPASMTKAQLQAALTAKGISFPAAADKAELLALLTQ